jgi:4-amino-4-deoxy-L-arabinose transferase-like glycosyltransferase
LLLFTGITAAVFRFWQLGALPPGLYRDEAINGLDALGVLRGDHALYFAANNGREPAYVYLIALGISLFGRTALAVRFGAALVGTLTTWLVFRLTTDWFDRLTGLLAAWLWAITLWPVHLSRIGLRAILLVPALTAALWLGTRAYRRPSPARWLLAGVAYGLTAYTYLAARFSPLLVLLLILLLGWRGGREARLRLRHGAPWAIAGFALSIAPLAVVALSQPELVIGRTGQVSILNPAINDGQLLDTLWRQLADGLGMFFWRGDQILRHNPAGRPVFDILMAGPFLLGVVWSLRQRRRLAASALLLWTGVMLGPTILAEDAPHFLRAVGVLPGALILAAVGLRWLAGWEQLPAAARTGLVVLVLVGSAGLTIRDYARYVAAPDTAYLFEAGARDLAEAIDNEPAATAVLVEQRLLEGWPSVGFLVARDPAPTLFDAPGQLPAPLPLPAAVYVWPHASLDALQTAFPAPVLLSARLGSKGRGDLEAEAYPLYARFGAEEVPPLSVLARFGENMTLRQADLRVAPAGNAVEVSLVWSAGQAVDEALIAFVHLVDDAGIVVQSDAAPADGLWPVAWWQPGQLVYDRHALDLDEPYNPDRHRLLIGLYEEATRVRLPVFTPDGLPVGDTWPLP